MGSTWGTNIKISVFGESHGEAVGIVMDGFPHGFRLNFDNIKDEMNKRKPGNNEMSVSQRKENDDVEIISGLKNEITTGAPICIIIKNEDYNKREYEEFEFTPRPSTADITGKIRYGGFNDNSGSGHFSGRLTAPIVAAGAICKQFLYEKYNITITSTIEKIGSLDLTHLYADGDTSKKIDEEISNKIKNEIYLADSENDSVGAKVMLTACNVKPGIGNPIFDNVESKIAGILFSIPAVKAVSFGIGELFSEKRGSEVNDIPTLESENIIMRSGEFNTDLNKEELNIHEIIRKSNNCGGIEGGITTGMDIITHVTFKPTPSIGKRQKTINLKTGIEESLEIKGRHDSCIAVRGMYVLESAMALALLDLILQNI